MKEVTRLMKTGIKFSNHDESYQALFTVHQHLNVVFEIMKQSSNGLSNSPQMVYSQLILVLRDKGYTGVLIAKAIEREVNATLNNPEQTLRDTAHGLSKKEMEDIKANGSNSLTTRHFNVIMTSLLEKAQRGESVYTIDSISELQMFSQRPLIHVDLYDDLEESNEDGEEYDSENSDEYENQYEVFALSSM